MKKISIITMSLLLFAGGLSFAQSTKYKTRAGIVKEATMQKDKNGKPKKIPLKGVIIETNEQARATSSDNGTFKLNISKAPFKITKAEIKDYTLLTPEAGKNTYHDGKDIIDILLVSDKIFNNYMDSQMKVATEEREKKKNQALEEIKQQKDEGKIKYGEYLQKQDSINEAYNEQMKRLAEFVERSSKEFFKGMEQIDKEIDDCIMKGDYLKADSLLISKGYFNERIKNIEKLKQVTEQLVKDAVSDCWKYYEINLDKIKYSEALAYLDTARVLQEKHFGLQNLDLAFIYHEMGFVYGEQGNLDKAMEFYDKALKIKEQVLNHLSPSLAVSYNNIGIVYKSQGDYDKAMEFYDKALKIEEQVLDPLSPDLAISYNNIGTLYSAKGDYDKAMEFYDKALKIEEQVLDSLSPSLAVSYNNIGGVYHSQKNYDKAMEFHDKALKIREQVLNPLSPDLAVSYSNIGGVYYAQKNYDKAMEFYDKALKIQEQVLNPLSPALATSYSKIGSVYWSKGDLDEALNLLNKALKIREQVLDSLSPALATSYNNIGLVYDSQGDYDKAMEFFDKALKIEEQVLNPLSPDLAISYSCKGTVYWDQGKYEEALEYYEKALPGFIKSYGEENKVTITLKRLIEQCKQALGK